MARPRIDVRRAAAIAAGGAAMLAVAFAFDAAALFVPAVAFALLGLATPAWVWLTAHGARVTRRLDAERVVEGDELRVTLEVTRGPLGLPGATVLDPCTGTVTSVADPLSPIHGGRRASVRVATAFARRGRHELPPPALTVRDPLDLARARIPGAPGRQTLLVLPRTEPVRWLAAGRARRLLVPDGGASASDALAAVDLDGLRGYRPGTPASRIHWPAVARGAGLLERRMRADGDARPLIVLDARTSGPAGHEDDALIDAAVRAAASLALELSAGGCALLLPGEQRATKLDRALAHWPDAYARLAVVAGGIGCPAPGLAVAGPRSGATIYVAAAPAPRVVAALRVRATGPLVLVVPAVALRDGRPRGIEGALVDTLAVSGCRGFLLGARRRRAGRPEGVAA